MKITDVKIRKLFQDEGAVKAIVSLTFDDQLALHEIRVVEYGGKTYICMPNRKSFGESYRDIVHPINAEFRAEIESAVLEAYKAALEKAAEAAEEDSSSVTEEAEKAEDTESV